VGANQIARKFLPWFTGGCLLQIQQEPCDPIQARLRRNPINWTYNRDQSEANKEGGTIATKISGTSKRPEENRHINCCLKTVMNKPG